MAGSALAKKVLIIAPSSLLKNWEVKFRKWLGSERIAIHIADTGDKVAQFRSYNSTTILACPVRCWSEHCLRYRRSAGTWWCVTRPTR